MSKDQQQATRRQLLGGLGGIVAGLGGCVTDEQGKRNRNTSSERHAGLDVDTDRPPADRAQAAWAAAHQARADTPAAAATRLEAAVTIERAVREAAVVLPLYHGLTERFVRDRVDVPSKVVPGTAWDDYAETTAPDEELTVLIDPIFSLDPLDWTGPPAGPLAAVYETLTTVDRAGSPTDQLLAGTNADGRLTRRLELESGVRFHDDRPLRAADVVYSWRRAIEADPELAAPWPRGLGLAVEQTDDGGIVPDSLAASLRAVDDRAVELRLTEPNPDLRVTIAESEFAVLPEGLVGDVTGYEGEIEQERLAERGSVGTGPFAIEAADLDRELRLRRAETYRGPEPAVERLRWLFREGEPAWTAILEDRADVFEVPEIAYDRGALAVEQTDRGRRTGTYGPVDLLAEAVRYRARPTRTTVYLGANAAHVPPAVRRAIADVVNRERLLDLAGGRRAAAGTVAPPGLWPTADEGTDPHRRALSPDPYGRTERRPSAAGDRLAAAGIGPDSPAEYTLAVPDSEPFGRIAERLADRLEALGVELAIEAVSTIAIAERGEAGRIELWLAGLRWDDAALATELSRLVPENTDTDLPPEDADGLYLNWQTELDGR